MEHHLKSLVNSYKNEMIKVLQEYIRIKSVSQAETDNQADKQGETGVQDALNYLLDLGSRLGFKSVNIDNLGGLIEFGEGKETIGIIVHADTVPEGEGWTFPPFEGQIQNGRIFGRGAIDNKGPTISALYAMKAVKDSGVTAGKKVQMIICLDEEISWNLTTELLKKIKQPEFSFIPDSRFPLINAEKGLLWVELKKDFNPSAGSGIKLKSLKGGDSLNMVPSYCEAVLEAPPDRHSAIREKLQVFQNSTGFNLEMQPESSALRLISRGKSVHASCCSEGKNAVSQMLLFLSELEITAEDQQKFIKAYAEKIGMDCNGESLGCSFRDEITGELTFNPAQIVLDKSSVSLKIDIRVPASCGLDTLLSRLREGTRDFDCKLEILDSLPPINVPENSEYVQTLLEVYRNFTGEKKARPCGIGGTTLAKVFKNAVAFGPLFPGMEKTEHQPDEYMEIDHLVRCAQLYAQALYVLITLPGTPIKKPDFPVS